LAIQRDPRVCEVYVDYPENLKILADALKEKPYELNTLLPVTELKNDWAVGQGYPDFEMYELTKSIGGDARLAEQLVSFNVTDTQSFSDAVNRMIKQGYSQEKSGRAVISFLSDEKNGAETKKSAVAIRDERVRFAKIEEKKRAEKAKAAAAARAAAEAERNKPLQKSRLKPGTAYKWYDDSSCKNSDSAQCLNKNQYQQMCAWAGGLTVNVRRMAAVMFRSPYSQFLAEGGKLTNIDYGWNTRTGQCRVSWSIVGMFKGTNVRENFSGYASNFIVTSNGKILIHYVSGR
ncbi:hypothetical protein N9K17_06155, partial [Burkholderiaceae bacterium]|nr:hypothetical protein [Burkholderiaceae bacterium]